MTADRDPAAGAGAGLQQLRRSPLAHRAADLAAISGGVRVSELPFLSMISLRVDPSSAAAARVEQALGVALPGSGAVATATAGEGAVAPGPASATGEGPSVLWLGPDEWLVVGADDDATTVLTLLDAAVGGDRGSVVEVSSHHTTLVIRGPQARDLLEKGCTVDLHPRSFGAGQCARTTFARGQLLLWQTDADGPLGPVYRLLIGSSFAGYFADWLTDAAAEFRSGMMPNRGI